MSKKRILTVLMAMVIGIRLFPTTVFAFVDESIVEEMVPAVEEKEVDQEISVGPLTPDGNMNLVDDYGGLETSGKQFITVTTKSGNYFYLVIDRDDTGNQTVHFLNLVDEADLLSLMDEEEVTEYVEQMKPEETAPLVMEPESEEPVGIEPEPEPGKKSTNWSAMMLLALLGIGGVGAFVMLSMRKKKQKKEATKPDPDADYEDEEEYDLPEDLDEEELYPDEEDNESI